MTEKQIQRQELKQSQRKLQIDVVLLRLVHLRIVQKK